MGYINLNIDFEVDEILSQCSRKNIEEIINYLLLNGYINKFQINKSNSRLNMNDDIWYESITKLLQNRHVLSRNKIERIEEIAKNIP